MLGFPRAERFRVVFWTSCYETLDLVHFQWRMLVFLFYYYLIDLSLPVPTRHLWAWFPCQIIFTAFALPYIPALQVCHPMAGLTLAVEEIKDGSGKNGEIQRKPAV